MEASIDRQTDRQADRQTDRQTESYQLSWNRVSAQVLPLTMDWWAVLVYHDKSTCAMNMHLHQCGDVSSDGVCENYI